MKTEEMRDIGEDFGDEAADQTDLTTSAVWLVGAEICERLDRLLELTEWSRTEP